MVFTLVNFARRQAPCELAVPSANLLGVGARIGQMVACCRDTLFTAAASH